MTRKLKRQLWSLFTHDFRHKFSCTKYELVSRFFLRPYLFVVPAGYDDTRYDIYTCSLSEMYTISLCGFGGIYSPMAGAYTFEKHLGYGDHTVVIDPEICDNMSKLAYSPQEILKALRHLPSIT